MHPPIIHPPAHPPTTHRLAQALVVRQYAPNRLLAAGLPLHHPGQRQALVPHERDQQRALAQAAAQRQRGSFFLGARAMALCRSAHLLCFLADSQQAGQPRHLGLPTHPPPSSIPTTRQGPSTTHHHPAPSTQQTSANSKIVSPAPKTTHPAPTIHHPPPSAQQPTPVQKIMNHPAQLWTARPPSPTSGGSSSSLIPVVSRPFIAALRAARLSGPDSRGAPKPARAGAGAGGGFAPPAGQPEGF